MADLTSVTKSHAALGASSSDRWMNCPGSVALSANLPGTTSIHAETGTAAHTLAERCLTTATDPAVFVGTEIDGIEVDEEMADAVRVFVETVRRAQQDDPRSMVWIEQQFDLSQYNPPAPMFGTADAVVWQPTARKLVVLDFKYGQGVPVNVIDNPQLRYYAVGALLVGWAQARIVPDTVELVIVQPRASHPDGIVRREVLDYVDVVEFVGILMKKAADTLAPNAKRVPGGWCRFCRAAAICPDRAQVAQVVAQTEFLTDVTPLAPPAPETLDDTTLANVLAHADDLEHWLSAVRAHVQARLERGESFPGYKLVSGRANRKWTSETALLAWGEEHGFARRDLVTEKVKTPAQVEKLVGKKALPPELVTKPEGKLTLAPDHDSRPAVVLTAGSEFAALPAPAN